MKKIDQFFNYTAQKWYRLAALYFLCAGIGALIAYLV